MLYVENIEEEQERQEEILLIQVHVLPEATGTPGTVISHVQTSHSPPPSRPVISCTVHTESGVIVTGGESPRVIERQSTSTG